jgi:hypothetical protein
MGRSTEQKPTLSEIRKYRKFTAQQKTEIVLASLRDAIHQSQPSLPTAEPGAAGRRRERADVRPAEYAEEPPHGRRGPRSVAAVSVACRSSNAADARFASTRRTRTRQIPGASHVT